MREHPRDRKLSERHARLLRQRSQRVHRRELALVPVALLVAVAGGAEREAGARRRSRVPAMLAGKKSARERVIRDDADAFVSAQREQIAFGLTKQQIEARLHALEARHPE